MTAEEMREFHKQCKQQKVQEIIDVIKDKVRNGNVSYDIKVNMSVKITEEQEKIMKGMGYTIKRLRDCDVIEVYFDTPNM